MVFGFVVDVVVVVVRFAAVVVSPELSEFVAGCFVSFFGLRIPMRMNRARMPPTIHGHRRRFLAGGGCPTRLQSPSGGTGGGGGGTLLMLLPPQAAQRLGSHPSGDLELVRHICRRHRLSTVQPPCDVPGEVGGRDQSVSDDPIYPFFFPFDQLPQHRRQPRLPAGPVALKVRQFMGQGAKPLHWVKAPVNEDHHLIPLTDEQALAGRQVG